MTKHSPIWSNLLSKIGFFLVFLWGIAVDASLWTPFTHKVVKGETLFEVSKKTGIRQEALIQQNQLKAPFALKEGQNLILPKPSMLEEREELEKKALEKKQSSFVPTPRRQGPKIKNEILKAEKLSGPKIVCLKKDEKKKGSQDHKRNLLKQKPSSIIISSKKLFFLKPVKGPILAPYGLLKNGTQNDGINIGAKKGFTVKATEQGTVIYRGNDIESYGNLVLIKHSDTWVSTYGHLKDIKIKRGERIKRGQIIGTVGTTGHVKKPQLHFELRRHHHPVDPTIYLEKKSA